MGLMLIYVPRAGAQRRLRGSNATSSAGAWAPQGLHGAGWGAAGSRGSPGRARSSDLKRSRCREVACPCAPREAAALRGVPPNGSRKKKNIGYKRAVGAGRGLSGATRVPLPSQQGAKGRAGRRFPEPSCA